MIDSNNKRTLRVILAVVGVLCVCSICAFAGWKLLVSGTGQLFDIFTEGGDEGLSQVTATPQPEVTEAPQLQPEATVALQPLPGGMGEFQYGDCPVLFDSERIECGTLTVPENRQDPDSREILLAVAIVRSASGQSQIPLVYLVGGPGGSAIVWADYLWLDSPLADDRDIILLDQRGTGYSIPTLNCVEYDGDTEEDSLNYWEESRLLEDCHDRLLADGIDLDMYNSAASAADVEDLRLAMGYSQIDLLGSSYGTRLALTMMRDHPYGIRSVILDSVYPPNVDAINEQSLINIQVLDILFQACQSDESCNQAYPQLKDVFYELIAEFNENPAEFTYLDDYNGEEVDEVLYGDNVVDILVDSLYDTRLIPYLPAFIFALSKGQYDYAYYILEMPYLDEELSIDEDYYHVSYEEVSDSEGMFYSVQCYEEVIFNDLDTAEELVDNYPDEITEGLLWGVENFILTCKMWGAPPAPAVENQAVISDIPTLLLAGEYDPITPPSWAEVAAQTLNNAQVFVFPGYGHAVIAGGSCPGTIALDFLADPFEPVDSSCLDGIGPPDFVVVP
jgi:pimeloyl-ACP methyl ester carboxylesterase